MGMFWVIRVTAIGAPDGELIIVLIAEVQVILKVLDDTLLDIHDIIHLPMQNHQYAMRPAVTANPARHALRNGYFPSEMPTVIETQNAAYSPAERLMR